MHLLYIGSRDGIEKKLVEKADVKYKGIICGKLRRYFSWENLLDFFKVPLGIFQAYRILKRFKPDIVFSKGGFVSVPVVIAAWELNIPIIIHESDVVPGLANKIASKFANKICLSFEESKKYYDKYSKKIIYTGNLVRSSIFTGDKNRGYKFTGFDKHKPVILIMGGSLGAQQINELVSDNLDELLKNFQIAHIRGRGNLDISIHKKGYAQYEYLNEYLPDIYAQCEIVVSRGGANSLAEIAMLHKKAVIIPLGIGASRGDQIQNAELFSKKFGWEVLDGKISRKAFIKSIKSAYEKKLKNLGFKNGASEVIKLILKKGK